MKEDDRNIDTKIINIKDGLPVDREQAQAELEDRLYEKQLEAQRRRVKTLFIVAAVVAVSLLFYIFVIRAAQPYTSVEEISSREIVTSVGQKYVAFDKGILQYGLNGASYIAITEKESWSSVYTMTDPRAEVSGDYAVIYDQNGTTAAVVNVTDGQTGIITTDESIQKATVSQTGAVCLSVEDDLANDMLFYTKDGTKLDIRIHTLLSESGYPLDIAFSPDGQILMASFVYIDSGVMQNQIVFYNFDTTRNSGTQTVGAFRKYGDTLFADVAFLSDDRAVACGDGQIVFYSLKNRTSPEELNAQTLEDTITCLTYSESGVALATTDGDKVQQRKLYVFNTDGESVYQTETNFDMEDMQLTANGLYLSGAGTLLYLDNKGKQFFLGNLETDFVCLNAASGRTELTLVGGSRFSYIKLFR